MNCFYDFSRWTFVRGLKELDCRELHAGTLRVEEC